MNGLRKDLNEEFLAAYERADRVCCEKFGVPDQGCLTYINRLNAARFAPRRDEVLTPLVHAYDLYQRGTNEAATSSQKRSVVFSSGAVVMREDLLWVKRFARSVDRKRDPLSLYLKRAKRMKRRKKFFRWFLPLLVLLAALAAAYFFFLK